MGTFVKSFAEMTKKDFQEAGGKAANLGELTQGGFQVPPGFCVTSPSLPYVIDVERTAADRSTALAASLDYEDYEGVENITRPDPRADRAARPSPPISTTRSGGTSPS